MCIGARIKARRKEVGLSAEELAPLVGVSPATMYRYEKEDTKKIPGQVLFAIATALNTSVDYLLGETDDPTPGPLLSSTEAALSHTAIAPAVFRQLLDLAGFNEALDEDSNVTIYKDALTINKTPELIERVMRQTVSYFAFLMAQEGGQR